MEVLVPISLGELYDKISILEIKLSMIHDDEKLKNIKKELILLTNIAYKYAVDEILYNELRSKNQDLWIVEDKLRIKEKNKEFDDEFIQLARSVYFMNDKRSEIKREINLKSGSNIIEEKSYEKYT
mgnify:CR=1 FL=1